MRAAVLTGERLRSDGEHRQAVRAGGEHFTRFQARFEVHGFLSIGRLVGRKQVHADAATGPKSSPDHQERKQDAHEVTAKPVPQVQQGQGHEEQEGQAHDHDRGPIGPFSASPVPGPQATEDHREDDRSGESQVHAEQGRKRKRGVREDEEVHGEDEHRAAVMHGEGRRRG